MSDVAQWLASHGLKKYAGAFADAEIEFDVLRDLTEADLEKLGIPLGPRKNLLKAITALRGENAAAGVSGSEQPAILPVRPEAERRQLTALFADMVGSTALSQDMDPEELREVIRGFQDAAAGAVARFDGYLAKFMGDGLLAYFGWPRAHEDDPERAVRAGLALVEASRMLKHPQQVRVGIATGLVVVGDVVGSGGAREEAAVGETLNLAARLQGEAAPGTVVLAPVTRALLGELFELESLGPRQIKGIAQPVEPWQVVGEAKAASRFEAARARRLSRLVGRDRELRFALARWGQAKAGKGQVVLLRADAGVGKSRIVTELRHGVDPEVRANLLYQCSPYHVNSALYPVIQQLTRAAGIETSDGADAKRLKLAELARRSNIESEEAVALLASLLSVPADERHPAPPITPQEQKAATLSMLCDLLAGRAASGPVLVIVEDLHWSDPTTCELLELIIGRIEELPVLMLVTFRPELEPPWEDSGHTTLVTLDRLDRQQVEALIREVANKPLPEVVVDQIVAKSDGVPLFVEELTKTVLEGGLLRAFGDGYELAGAPSPLAVPSSLQASLVSRLDRLAPVREVAQIAAALGREFDFEMLVAVAPHDRERLVEALSELHRAELVFPRGSPPHTVWAFKHALIRDAAYETMLKSARVQLHGRIARAIRTSFAAVLELEPEVYARHLTEAGIWPDAVQAWRAAARRVALRSASTEARALLHQAIGLLPRLEDPGERDALELDLQIEFASVLMAARGMASEEVVSAYKRAHELTACVADPARRIQSLKGLWRFHMAHGHLDQAMEVALEKKQAAEAIENHGIALEVLEVLGASHIWMGSIPEGIRHLEAGLQAYRDEDAAGYETHIIRYSRDPGIAFGSYLSMAYATAGLPDRARQQISWVMDLAERRNHAFTLWVAASGAAAAALILRDIPKTMDLGELMLGTGIEYHLPMSVGAGLFYINWARSWDDPGACSMKDMARGVELIRASVGKFMIPAYETSRADAMLRVGRQAEAESLLDDVLKDLQDGQRGYLAPETFRLRGVAYHLQGATGLAEGCFRRALKVAELQGQRWLQLRAAVDLTRLLLDRSEQSGAHDLLKPMLMSFDEGFDLPDLNEAKAILDRCT
ncbi:AAA family ATPase [Vineibacter terrae]|uniref:AAA family ATPase n=1 Tax=Vineibacter terrae TaxID=2586908 RepID=UPI002E36AD21|nr:adenylate/guanylate cyclase domain-containing protein [Vineibacter terrae]HEX2888006.1 adenylate/guanylate cyclase domain-containing protein [Vineibacter terrae]